jgi:hypothetical protein
MCTNESTRAFGWGISGPYKMFRPTAVAPRGEGTAQLGIVI